MISEEAMKNRKIFVIIMLALMAFNISALATILYYRYINKEPSAKDNKTQFPNSRYALWFRDQLDLNDEQFLVFREANRTYHWEGREIIIELDDLRKELLEELGKDTPDEARMADIAQRMGELHTALKGLTISYYMMMKNACTPEQQKRLFEIFKDMVDHDGNASIPEGGLQKSNK